MNYIFILTMCASFVLIGFLGVKNYMLSQTKEELISKLTQSAKKIAELDRRKGSPVRFGPYSEDEINDPKEFLAKRNSALESAILQLFQSAVQIDKEQAPDAVEVVHVKHGKTQVRLTSSGEDDIDGLFEHLSEDQDDEEEVS